MICLRSAVGIDCTRQYVACQPDDQSGFLVHYSRPFGQSELCLRCRELFGGEPFAQYQLLRSHGPRSGRRAYPHRMAGRPEAGVPGLQPVRQRHPHAVCRGGCQLQPGRSAKNTKSAVCCSALPKTIVCRRLRATISSRCLTARWVLPAVFPTLSTNVT